MSKINEWLLDREQQGKKAFIDTPDGCNDAHCEDNKKMSLDVNEYGDFYYEDTK